MIQGEIKIRFRLLPFFPRDTRRYTRDFSQWLHFKRFLWCLLPSCCKISGSFSLCILPRIYPRNKNVPFARTYGLKRLTQIGLTIYVSFQTRGPLLIEEGSDKSRHSISSIPSSQSLISQVEFFFLFPRGVSLPSKFL